jgi:hypothetical protein
MNKYLVKIHPIVLKGVEADHKKTKFDLCDLEN